MAACSGTIAWMKMNDYTRGASPISKYLLFSIGGPVNGGRTGASRPRSDVFLFKICKYEDVMKFTVLFL